MTGLDLLEFDHSKVSIAETFGVVPTLMHVRFTMYQHVLQVSLSFKGLDFNTVDFLWNVEWCIGKTSCSSIILYITSITHDQYTNIYPLSNILTYISTYSCWTSGGVGATARRIYTEMSQLPHSSQWLSLSL